MLARPLGAAGAAHAAGLCLHLLASAVYKRVIYGTIPVSHVRAACARVLLAVSLWETRLGRSRACAAAPERMTR